MRAVTAAEIEHYRENGFVVLENLLDVDELESWRAKVSAAVERRVDAIPGTTTERQPDDVKRRLGNQLTSSDLPEYKRRLYESMNDRTAEEIAEQKAYYERVFVQRVNLWQTSEAVYELIMDEQIGKLAAELAGVDGVRLWHDQALFKPPFGNPTAWHLDVPYWSFTSPHALSMWVALDDASPENGCLYFLPGSHKAQKYDNVGIGKELGSLFDVYPEWKDIDPVPAPMPAGSASFHNGLTAHGASANMTPRSRRAMTLQFMPDGATYNGAPHDVLPPEYLSGLSVGDPLDDDAITPLLWSRV